jgi:DNA-binding MarR family transcriptional regulator
MQREPVTSLLYRLINQCRISDQEIMDQLGLSPAQFHFFLVLPPDVESVCCSDAASILRLSQSRSSRIMDTLVKDGFVVRKSGTNDRRRVFLKLTPKGREIKKVINDYKKRCERSILNKLSNEEIRSFKRRLDKLYEVME